MLATTFNIFHTYIVEEVITSWYLRFILWSLYTVLQGIFGTGVWVMGHDCGHQAFWDYRTLNDTVGWIFHSFLLMPYFSWKITHKQHHAMHNNLAKDMAWVPKTRTETFRWGDLAEEMPLFTALKLVVKQLLGMPIYLLFNGSGS